MSHTTIPPFYSATLDTLLTRYRIGIWRAVLALVVALLFFGKPDWQGSPVSWAMVTLGVVGVSLATVGRLWCALYISGRKSGVLVDQGPYSMCRHPLYVCNFLGMTGLGLLTESLLITAILVSMFMLLYPAVMRTEDRFLSALLPGHAEYARQTPAFWPSPAQYRSANTWLVHVPAYLRNIADSIWFILGGALIESVDRLHEMGYISSFIVLP